MFNTHWANDAELSDDDDGQDHPLAIEDGRVDEDESDIMTIKLTKLWGATHKHSCKCYATLGSTYR